ncbi:putative secreted protein (Por secretion system target) [Lacibacter cauensis]|uniref:Putative secreted protein (Por secretion system target) n=1 Tax=Lacibacter cauensis TaxID=510947 RepID=A0A562SKG2_9BACT|nr:putative secreted protein (Por secretion system target) [Lacibacter cauensis]
MKLVFAFTISLFLSFSVFSQVGTNNACASALNIVPVTGSCPTTTYSLQNATATTGLGTTKYDAWYKFTTPANIRNVTVSIPTSPGSNLSSANLFIEAFPSNTCPSDLTSSLGLATEGAAGLSLSNLSPNTEYLFRVYSTTNPTGGAANSWNYTVCVSYTAVPANDNCSGAITLTAGTTNSAGNLSNATASGTAVGCATGTPDDDVWYKFTTGTTQRYASITVTPGATLNANGAMIQLYSGNCTSLTSIACGQNQLTISDGLLPSTEYFIRVYSSAAYSTAPTAGAASNNFSILVSSPGSTNITAGKMNEVYRQTILSGASLLADPWEITYGPDNYLWVTEAKGYKLNRIHPVTGAKQVVLDISQNSTFFSSPADQAFNCQFNNGAGAQGGFAGMALHPKFLDPSSPQNYVYISYVHSNPSTAVFVNRIVRFFYNTSTNKLESPVSICDTIPGSQDHNSQRMIITPMTKGGNDYYLFYAAGDMGAGQQYPTLNIVRPMKAQHLNAYEGKILRFALSDSCSGTGNQKWIPDSNPYNNVAPIVGKSAVWSIGMRNNQGFAYNPELNILYGSSHGPFSDDEINIIEGFKNYGHPLVVGYAADGNYNGTTTPGLSTSITVGVPYGWTDGTYPTKGQASAASSAPPIGNEMANANAINANASLYGAYKDPIFSAYPGTGTGTVSSIWSAATTSNNATWHSEGWSGLDLYTHTYIPGWKNSLLAAGLKWGRTIRLKLNDAGTAVIPVAGADTVTYFQSGNRYRDIAFAPNGREIFLAMDRSPASSAATVGSPPATVGSCLGCVIRYEFLGYNPASTAPFTSTIPTSIPIDAGNLNNCATGTAVTINAENGNNNLWVPITGPDGNVVAEIDANGNNLGNVTSSFYTKAGAARQIAGGVKYMNRNITINVQNQPSSNVSVRLYITENELQDMITSTGGSVSGINDIGIFKNNDGCGNALSATPTSQTITGRYTHGTYGYAIQSDISSFSTFYFMSTSATLPANVITFKATAVGNNAKLLWTVEDQQNVERYVIERSSNNISFSAFGSVDARGTANEKIEYQFTDINAAAFASTVYYRIKITDKDGSAKYTNVVPVSFENFTKAFVTIQPNPVVNNATVMVLSTTEEMAQLRISDNTGRVVMSKNIRLIKGRNTLELNVNSLPSGLYYLDVTGKNINQKTKLVKQ